MPVLKSVRSSLFRLMVAGGLAGGLLAAPGAGFGAAPFTCPVKNTILFPGVTGAALQDSLRVQYRPPQTWGYNAARDESYARIDNHNGNLSCIYTGYTVHVDPNSPTPRADAFAAGINAEHTWPQSKGADNLPMMADLHHLFPSEIQANADRGNFPFDEIPDAETDAWYRLKVITSTPEIELIDEYSELDHTFPGTAYGGRWEPREVRKGDVARAQFYFWTVYRAEATAGDPNFFNAEKNALRQWAHDDTVDAMEYARTCAIAPHEGGKVNPFVIDPTLVDRAYFGGVPVVLVAFVAQAEPDGVRLSWQTSAEVDHAGFNVVRSEAGRETRLNAVMIPAGSPYEFMDRSGRPGTDYRYWIEAIGRAGGVERFGPRAVRFPEIGPAVSLWPNPVRLGAPLNLLSSGSAASRAELFDAAGRRVGAGPGLDTLKRGWVGQAAAVLDVTPGVYFLRVTVETPAGHGARARTLRLVVVP